MAAFVDRVTLHATAGNGGHGCVSIKREKFKPLGGPDGGNGGDGGDIILRVDPQVTTLLDFHHLPHRKAGNGEPGKGGLRPGKQGLDLILGVPAGTVIKTRDGDILADLVNVGDEFLAAAGGQGGLGNAAISSDKRKAPGFALLGIPGQEQDVVMELKSVADIALVGYPSAGKSSLIAAVSAARPKIADYPFTTLVPNLGVVQAGEVRFTVADVPGLIPGASEGKGLGHEFLRHVERCAAIVHVLDCASLESDRDPISDLETIEAELANYEADSTFAGTDGTIIPLVERPKLVALNKVDMPDGKDMAEFVRPELERRGYQVFEISALSRDGLRDLSFAMAKLVEEARASRVVETPVVEVPVIRPRSVNKQEFYIRREEQNLEPLWRVIGEKPERWIMQTDFRNDEAVGYLADRLAKLGVENQLFKSGAKPGDAVVIGAEENSVVFDWEPTMAAGAELLGSRRGEDVRLEDRGDRKTREEKRVEHEERKAAKAAARDELEAERRAGIWTESVHAKAAERKAKQRTQEEQ